MDVLGIIHEPPPCSGVFAEAAAARGDTIEEWNLVWGTPPSRPLDEYEAAIVFGGVMDTHQEEEYPWLVDENLLLQSFLDRGTPLLGICLGGQLIAKAMGARVARAPYPEIGFVEVDVLPAAQDDPVLAGLPGPLMALQWHSYRFDLPPGAVPLARNDTCLQAYRVGDAVWGLQFHAETTHDDWLRWTDEWDALPGADRTGFDPARMKADAERYMERWNEVGRQIASRFLQVAERCARLTKTA